MRSWKTSVAGIALLIAAIMSGLAAIFDGDPTTSIDVNVIIGAAAGVGLWFARDNDTTSERAGAKQ